MPDRNRKPHGGGPEIEIAYYTKELGKALQREMLQKQLNQLSESGSIRSSHGEDLSPEAADPTPDPDRAG